jgi:DNA-binding NarL/FixJ family response regulator
MDGATDRRSGAALLVEDHPIVADALRTALAGLQAFDRIDHESTLADATKRLDESADYDLILLDLGLSDASGTTAMVRLRETFPDIPIVIVSADESTETLKEAFEHGVRGYIPKSSNRSVIIDAIQVVLDGSSYIPPHAMGQLGISAPASSGAASTRAASRPAFTPRQEEVFRCLLEGMPNKVIAARLHMAEGTVKTHLNTIYRVLGARNRAQVILIANQLGLI